MKEKRIRPKAFILATDGEPNGDDWGDPVYCPTLFLIINNQIKRAPFGRSVMYE